MVAEAQLLRDPLSFIGVDEDKRAVLEVARTAAKEVQVREVTVGHETIDEIAAFCDLTGRKLVAIGHHQFCIFVAVVEAPEF